NAEDLPLTQLNYSMERKRLTFVAFEKGWNLDFSSEKVEENKELTERLKKGNGYWGARNKDGQDKKTFSPDSQWVAYIKNYNVYLQRRKGADKEIQLSFDGSAGEYYDAWMAWSPDSKKLAAMKVRKNEDHTLYLIESSPDEQLQPKLQTRDYLKP